LSQIRGGRRRGGVLASAMSPLKRFRRSAPTNARHANRVRQQILQNQRATAREFEIRTRESRVIAACMAVRDSGTRDGPPALCECT
jgi:hypothetical protein